MAKREPITFADSVSDLPVSGFSKRLAELRIAREFAVQSTANDNLKQALKELATHVDEKSMVEKDRPHPAPRPSAGWAAEFDATDFDARWEAERQRHIQSH